MDYLVLTKDIQPRQQWRSKFLPKRKLFFSHACFSQEVSFERFFEVSRPQITVALSHQRKNNFISHQKAEKSKTSFINFNRFSIKYVTWQGHRITAFPSDHMDQIEKDPCSKKTLQIVKRTRNSREIKQVYGPCIQIHILFCKQNLHGF